jgi:hypothetical protein
MKRKREGEEKEKKKVKIDLTQNKATEHKKEVDQDNTWLKKEIKRYRGKYVKRHKLKVNKKQLDEIGVNLDTPMMETDDEDFQRPWRELRNEAVENMRLNEKQIKEDLPKYNPPPFSLLRWLGIKK